MATTKAYLWLQLSGNMRLAHSQGGNVLSQKAETGWSLNVTHP